MPIELSPEEQTLKIGDDVYFRLKNDAMMYQRGKIINIEKSILERVFLTILLNADGVAPRNYVYLTEDIDVHIISRESKFLRKPMNAGTGSPVLLDTHT